MHSFDPRDTGAFYAGEWHHERIGDAFDEHARITGVERDTVYVSQIAAAMGEPTPRNRAERRAAARLTPRCPHCGRAYADCYCHWTRR